MSGPACKVITDYGLMEAAAEGLSVLALATNHPALAAEAKAMSTWAYAGWVTALRIVEEYAGASGLDGGVADDVKKVLDESYAMCDWAKEVRHWCSILGPTTTSDKIAQWTNKLREWQAADAAVLTAIAESDLPDGYVKPPA